MTPPLTPLLLLSPLVTQVMAGGPSHQARLLQDLMDNSDGVPGRAYSPLFIPRKNSSEALEVSMEAQLHKIIEFDTDKGILTTSIWLDMAWWDDFLTWDPENYGGVTTLRLPPSKVWTPDMFLFNDATGNFGSELTRDTPFLVIESDGHVRWIPPLVLRTLCEHTDQSRAVQSCEIKFGSWVYNAHQLDLTTRITTMDLEGFSASSIWDLVSASVSRKETRYDCCPEPYVDITYNINFQERNAGWVFDV